MAQLVKNRKGVWRMVEERGGRFEALKREQVEALRRLEAAKKYRAETPDWKCEKSLDLLLKRKK